jgi:hypothetical protein
VTEELLGEIDQLRSKTANEEPLIVQRLLTEWSRIAKWLVEYAKTDKWRDASKDGEISHFANHAAEYIEHGWFQGDLPESVQTNHVLGLLQALEPFAKFADVLEYSREHDAALGSTKGWEESSAVLGARGQTITFGDFRRAAIAVGVARKALGESAGVEKQIG